jgi:anhydro-N-acetylmuramic acid kinase
MKSYHAIGVMSGTSLDGLDIALCEFLYGTTGWKYRIHAADTVPYSKEWKERLKRAPVMSACEILRIHVEFGKFIGREVKYFLSKTTNKPTLICSHGHTVFHQPHNGFTFQLGDGSAIAATTGITTISDFRNLSVALGGQGAPLVPVGDEILFGNYHYCLNLGGISNISYRFKHKRIAFDICPVNMILNHLAQDQGKEYDKDGIAGRKGNLDEEMLSQLESLPYYVEKPPKTLGREWLEAEFLPIIEQTNLKPQDKLRTVYEHIALRISQSMKSRAKKNVLVTGGGANNSFLLELIKSKTNHQIIVPDPFLVKFKEALIFAFLGILRLREQVNCFASVTGSSYDCSGGAVHIII